MITGDIRHLEFQVDLDGPHTKHKDYVIAIEIICWLIMMVCRVLDYWRQRLAVFSTCMAEKSLVEFMKGEFDGIQKPSKRVTIQAKQQHEKCLEVHIW